MDTAATAASPESGAPTATCSPADVDGGPATTGSGRAIQACDRCRLKKVRCDGLLPTCGRCRLAGLECLTMVKLTRKSYPRSYTESIEERLRAVESEALRLRADNAAQAATIRELEAAARARSVAHASPQPAELPPPPGSTASGRRDNRAPLWRGAPDGDDDDDDGSREVGRMNSDRRGVGRYMGAASGIFFVGLAQLRFAALARSSGGGGAEWSAVGHDLLRAETDDDGVHAPRLRNDDFEQALPPYETAVACCDAWFEFWRFIFPILHRPTFMRNLELVYFKRQTVPDADVPAEIFAIFYLVLALGSRLMQQQQLGGADDDGGPPAPPPPLHGAAAGDAAVVYFDKAMSYADAVARLGTLRTLQFQELLVLWHVSAGQRSRALQLVGSITRLALELGLHRASARFAFDALTTEVRKRTFWVCYILDTFLSSTAGLPKSLHDDDITADPPSPIDDPHVSAAGYLPALAPPGMHAFVALVAAARLASAAHERLYTTTARHATAAKIRQLDRHLDAWAATLPEHLHIDFALLAHLTPAQAQADLGAGAPEIVFAQLVHLHARLLVHRPALARQPQTAQSRASLRCCVETAGRMLLLLDRFRLFVLPFDVCPGAAAYTLWQCGLLALYGAAELRGEGERDARQTAVTCLGLLEHLVACGRRGEAVRARNIRDVLAVTATSASRSEPAPGNEPQQSFTSQYSASPQLAGAAAQPPPSPLAHFLSPPAPFTPSDLATPPAPPPLHTPLGVDFATAFALPPYARFGVAEPAAPGRRGPGDLWDDPVFAAAGCAPGEGRPELTERSPVVLGTGELYEEAAGGGKRRRVEGGL